MAATTISPKVRSLIIGAAAAALVLFITQVVLPGSNPAEGQTPPAILFTGVLNGLLVALVVSGVILIYRSSRIINFAQGSIGAAGGVFTYNLATLNGWHFFLAFAVGVLVAALVGFTIYILFVRRFFNAPRLVLTVITIALFSVIFASLGFIQNLPLFPPFEDRTPDEVRGIEQVKFPFSGFEFEIGVTKLTFGFRHLFAFGVSILVIIALAAFLRYTRMGTAIRATAENPERSSLLGISVGAVSMVVWIIAGALSGVGVILSGAVTNSFTGGGLGPDAVITALVAAVIARMHSFPIGVASAIGLSVLKDAISWSYEDQLVLLNAGLFVIVLVALLFQRKGESRSEGREAAAWKASEEARAIPKEMLTVGAVRRSRVALIAIVILVFAGLPFVFSPRQVNQAGYLLIIAIISLSLVVLTGWAGQVSLGQFAFVSVGAVVGGALTQKYSFWLALPIVPVFVAGFAILIGIPALRIRGLFLAIVTSTFAFALSSVLFEERYFGWLLPDRVDRPTAFGLLDFEDEKSMYYLALAGLLFAIVVVSVLRKSRVGRLLIAIRENEANVQSFGVSVVRMRLAAFAFSGALCGLCGVLLAIHQRAAAREDFPVFTGFQLFLYTVVGGVGSIVGGLLGAVYFAITQLMDQQGQLFFFVSGPLILFFLYAVPGGLASLFYGARDGVLRIIAQRRQMIVPALFADVDPTAVFRRLIPLYEPIPNAGLAALPLDRRYKGPSPLYASRGRLYAARQSSESQALTSAAKSVKAAEDKDLEVLPLSASPNGRAEET